MSADFPLSELVFQMSTDAAEQMLLGDVDVSAQTLAQAHADVAAAREDVVQAHKETAAAQADVVQAHKETAAAKADVVQAHKQTAAAHEETDAAHKETAAALEETAAAKLQVAAARAAAAQAREEYNSLLHDFKAMEKALAEAQGAAAHTDNSDEDEDEDEYTGTAVSPPRKKRGVSSPVSTLQKALYASAAPAHRRYLLKNIDDLQADARKKRAAVRGARGLGL